MPRQSVSAAKSLFTSIAAAILAFLGNPAHAQSDPFAIPKDLTAETVTGEEGPGLSEIAVDGALKPRMVDLAWKDGALTIDADNARVAGLPVADGQAGYIALAELELATWSFDRFLQRLDVQLMRQSDGGNLIDLRGASRGTGTSTPLTVLRVDYDLSTTLNRGKARMAGYADAALVRGNFAFGTSMQLASHPGAGRSALTRLQTTAELALPDKGIVVTAGDFVSAGAQSQRALRLGGLQIASDFALRPDLVTTPLPAFVGQVSVPTGLELIAADRRYSVGEVQPGEFTVRNVPTSAGRGEVAIVLKDSAGREIIQNTRFYTSRSLLAPDLAEFAVNAGFVRRRYGETSNDYGDLVASAFYRRGLSSSLTAEISGEWTAGLINAGARTDFVIGNIALASLDLRFSHENASGAGGRTGGLASFSLESVGRRFSARAGGVRTFGQYRDAASRLGDPPPPQTYFAQVSFNLADQSRLQISAARQEIAPDPRFPDVERKRDTLDLAFRTRLFDRFDLFANAGYRSGRRKAYTGFVGLSMQLGNGRSMQASANITRERVSGSASYRKFDNEEGDIGYAIDVSGDAQFHRVAGTLSKRMGFARLEAQVEQVNGRFAARANARGSLMLAGGTLFARNQSGGAYALVRTGDVDGITVTRENREAGVTARGGLLLIENVPEQVPITIDIDADKLPYDVLARTTMQRVVVPRRAVGLVELDVIRFIPKMFRLVTPQGETVPAGARVTFRPSGETTLVGFDGLVELNAAGEDIHLVAGRGPFRCEATLGEAMGREEGSDIVCAPSALIANDDAGREGQDAPTPKVARRN